MRTFIDRWTGTTKGKVRRLEEELAAGRIDKNEYYDRLTGMVMSRVLRPGSVCVDVGCHAGALLREMMLRAPGGRFLAFEPLPHLYDRLRGAFPGESVRLFNLALSDSAGVSEFNYVVTNPGYSGLKKRRYDRPRETDAKIEVKTDTLDNVLERENPGPVALIKVDVEGAEYLVFQGAQRCLRRDRPCVIFEHGLGGADCYGVEPKDVFSLLDRCGLSVFALADWLLDKPPLTPDAFSGQYRSGENYYFMACAVE